MPGYLQSKTHGDSDSGPTTPAAAIVDAAQDLLGNSGVLDWMGGGEESAEAAPATATTMEVGALQQAPASTAFDDGGGYFWEVDSDGNFVCVDAPEGQEAAIGKVITPEDHPETWAMLHAMHEAQTGPGEEPPTAPPADAPEEEQGWIDWIVEEGNELWEDVAERSEDLWGWTSETPVGEAIGDFYEDWLGEDAGSTGPTGPAGSRDEERQKHLDEGKTNVLDEAVELADSSDSPHLYDGDMSRDQDAGEVRDTIRDGSLDGLDRVGCGEFVTAAIAASGFDLNQPYLDPGTGHLVAYAEGSSARVVEIGMITNQQREAVGAILEAQNGTATLVTSDTPEAEKLGLPDSTFLYAGTADFIGMDVDADDVFGAGAAAVALGGYEVSGSERRPGDVQQRQNVSDGKYAAAGHASIVHAAKGTGVALLGATGSPALDTGGYDNLSGWYRIDGGVQMVVGPLTDPATVGSLQAVEIQQIDANKESSAGEDGNKRGSDATQVGSFAEDKENAAYCMARLPTSPWFAWSPSGGENVQPLPALDQKETETEANRL